VRAVATRPSTRRALSSLASRGTIPRKVFALWGFEPARDPSGILHPVNDTDPRAAAVQIELLRRAGPERRAAIAGRLSDDVIRLSRRALREQSPADLDELELKLRWVELHYGSDLAPRVRAYLAARRR
jgi:hypothetical protein